MLQQIDIQALCQNSFSSIILGKPYTGKTTIIKNMFSNLFESGITRFRVVTPTPQEWESNTVVPEVQNLERIWEDQKYFSRDTGSKLVVILDNCGYNRKIMNSTTLSEIVINGHYYNTTLICSIQYLSDIPPALHSFFDIVFACRSLRLPDLQKLHRFFSNEETYDEFYNIIAEISTTPLYTALVLNANSPRAPIGYMSYLVQN
jgi:hypothetical protein